MPKNERRKSVRVGDEDRDPISAALKQLHDSVVAEPIPEDLLKLIDQLDSQSQKQ